MHATEPRCAIGLDVGGTKIAGGVVSFPSGEIVARETIPTAAHRGGAAVLEDVFALAERLADAAQQQGYALHGIGIGVPELVDANGVVASDHAIAWRGVPVAQRFVSLAPAIVDADVRVAARAEAVWGAGRAFATFAYVTVGTGISYSLVQDGSVYAGTHGNALVLGSSPLTTTCTNCGAVMHPVLEDFAAGPALVARYNARAAQPVERGEDVIGAAANGDDIAVEIVRTAGEALGVSVGFLVNVLDPAAIVVGGGLGQVDGLYWSSFVDATREHIWADASRNVPILHAGLRVDAGLVGAAALWWQHMGEH